MVTAVTGRAGEASDAEVIQQSWQTPDSFSALYDRYANLLYGYAYQRVGQIAEDLVADVFLAAFAQRHRYDVAHSSARPWLFGILTNKIARRGRVERAHYRAYARAWQAPVTDGVDQLVAERVSAQAHRAHLAAALCRLRPGDRNVLLLVAWGQLRYEEVAQAMGIPVGTVRSRLNRARRIVRQALTDTQRTETAR
ncbi:MAG: RNA polymerase sigma factor [Micromonosporaceae bacterium]|nr:RNA polymerase sigma factor [Micromonosporaceae bacterium]